MLKKVGLWENVFYFERKNELGIFIEDVREVFLNWWWLMFVRGGLIFLIFYIRGMFYYYSFVNYFFYVVM